jgi:hypothetical protein
MSDKNKEAVTIVFKEELLKSIPKVIAKVGLAPFFDAIISTVPQFIPQDTQTLVNNHYKMIDEEKLVGIVGYGSEYGDDLLNTVAIVQHEHVLNHNGEPGRSMREVIPGANIPGKKYSMRGHPMNIHSDVFKKQRNDYQKGYRQLKKSNSLTPYASQYLEKAVHKVLQGNMAKYYNENIADFVAKGQDKSDEKNPKQKIKGL